MGSISHPKSTFSPASTLPLFLDGKQITLAKTFDVVSPVTHQVLYKCSAVTEEDATRAPDFRRDIFLRAANLMEKRADDMLYFSHTEIGVNREMFNHEHGVAVGACRSIAGLIQVATTSTSPVIAAAGRSALVVKEPYGMVLGISPWNIPHVLALRACLQPLAMGNIVLLKGPEAAPGIMWGIASALHDAGLPAGCLNTLYHDPKDAAIITSKLIAHPAIKKINFTGSTRVGSIIAAEAGKYLKPTLMELGGKAPAIVCEDADLAKAARGCVDGAFINSGQICMSTERIIVNSKVAEEFRKALMLALKDFSGTQGWDVAQLVSDVAVINNTKLITDALSKGAQLLADDMGHCHGIESASKLRPTIITGESFGPVVSLLVVDSDSDAIAIANDTEYGLASAVYTEDLRRGMRIAKEIESGAVHINSMTVHDEPALPHGGVKESGWGRFSGLAGLDEWAKLKNISWAD
ncbi:vanillin dehydrogenase [Trichoderma pleuroticola]